MCGIAGIVRTAAAVQPDEIARMAASLYHRGPDDEGAFVEDGVGLGMRRLAILDLSAAGRQPMRGEDGNAVLVFNGEIYNFRELRARLVEAGHKFAGGCDAEVVLHGFEEWGDSVFAALEGMFAAAVLDRRARRLVLARDPFGIKPLYLRAAPGQISFASEVRAFQHDGRGTPALDASWLGAYLRVGSVPSPHTAWQGVTRLEPGSLLSVDLATGQQTPRRFYELRPAPLSGRELSAALEERLSAAVERELVADVGVGLFLSGGLDSSALAWLAARHTRGRLRTFSMGFERADDETGHAERVARAVGADHTVLQVTPEALTDLAPIVDALEEPLADSAMLPLWHLCRKTRAHVTVALSGEGGDEALGGYGRYFWWPVAERAQGAGGLLAALARVGERLPARSSGVLNMLRRAHKFAATAELPEVERYLAWFDLFTTEERAALCGDGSPTVAQDRVESLFDRAHALALDPVQRVQYVDVHTMLPDNLLLKSDKLSMAHSLEVRVPMLERAVLELGLALPMWAKVGPAGGKPLLRAMLARALPWRIAWRPKRGFEIPVDAWFRDDATRSLRERLLSGALVSRLGFRRTAVLTLVERHLLGEDLGRKLFALLVLDAWAERYA